MNKATIMTVFYQKRTGKIKCIADYDTSIMNYFVDEADALDHELIWDCIQLDFNEFVFLNQGMFKVDIDSKQLTMDSNFASTLKSIPVQK